eukprot:CAMPEP_0115869942 /NCGR_PEP_ID=MMETSP0287-20121206/22067_1 /TAXON_ID=412157 /ORGANISM="Chrysochromulina rotalis, Strain UIO044" /LENGTH=608 /DNA_ID=CAMNT_0003324641 /DNA_START=17 /DNA_END=1843 /DNA_ORIENTATION=-
MAPKMSKAEKEAEMERLRLEAEAAAEKAAAELAEMEAARDKEEKERQLLEAALLAELDARVEEETAANDGLHAERKHELASEMFRLHADQEWQAYLACAELPDVCAEGEVNTFIATWQEKPTGTLWSVMPECSDAITVTRSLLLESSDAFSRGGDSLKQYEWQMSLQKQIVAEIDKKIDGATAEFLGRAEELKMVELPDLSVTIELPKALALASIAVRVTQYEDDVVSPYASEEAKAAASLMALGGVFKIDLCQLPAPAKTIKGFTMRAINEMSTSVVQMEYPIRGADGQIPTAAPPLRISYVLPPTVLLAEGLAPQVGWWEADMHELGEGKSEDRGKWSTDGIDDIKFDEATRTLSFDTLHLTALTLLQPTHLELPYTKWLFEPKGPRAGELHVATQRNVFRFALSTRGVVLKAPQIPDITDAAPMTAPVLLLRLRSCGINLCPKDSDAEKLERVTPKQLSLEEGVNASLCPLLPRYYLTGSKWNQSRGKTKCTLRYAIKPDADSMTGFDGAEEPAREDPFEVVESDWSTLLCQFRRVTVITANDETPTCDERPPKEEIVPHSTPLDALKGEDPEMVDVLRGSSVLYQDTVRQLLNSLRLFSFTKTA